MKNGATMQFIGLPTIKSKIMYYDQEKYEKSTKMNEYYLLMKSETSMEKKCKLSKMLNKIDYTLRETD